MSKNIVIQEGGIGKQMTVNKLKTDKVGGGTQLWVPEDEAGDYANYEELSVTENGTYVPSENADGFSKIDVDVNPELEDITITRNGVYESHQYGYGRVEVDVEGGGGDIETGTLTVNANGTYHASDDDLDGYDEVIVDIDDALTLKELTVNENGTYRASDDDADGYYIVNVNVSGGIGSATNDGLPTTENGVAPGGIGSSVVGWDEVDGNEYAIGVDSSGNLVKTKVPSGIEIGTPPTKTNYNSGEAIDYSGIIVILKGGDDAMFSDAKYPNGRVPFDELVFPIDKAHGGGGVITYTTLANDTSLFYRQYGLTFSFVEIGVGTEISGTLDGKRKYILHSCDDKVFAVLYPGSSYEYVDLVSEGNFSVIFKEDDGSEAMINRNVTSTGYAFYNIQCTPGKNVGIPLQEVLSNRSYGVREDMITFGKGHGSEDVQIPVQWKSPYDGRTFEDTFEITVTGSGSGSTDGGGYSDDSGGSSSL